MSTSTDASTGLYALRLVEEHLDRMEGLLAVRRGLLEPRHERELAMVDRRMRAHLAGLGARRDDAIQRATVRLHSPVLLEAAAALLALLDLAPLEVRTEKGVWRARPPVVALIEEAYPAGDPGAAMLGATSPVLRMPRAKDLPFERHPKAPSSMSVPSPLGAFSSSLGDTAPVARLPRVPEMPFTPATEAQATGPATREARVGSGTVEADFAAVIAAVQRGPLPFDARRADPAPAIVAPARRAGPVGSGTVETDFSAIVSAVQRGPLPFEARPAAETSGASAREAPVRSGTIEADFSADAAPSGTRPREARVGSATVEADVSSMVAASERAPLPFQPPTPAPPLPPAPTRRDPRVGSGTVEADFSAIVAAVQAGPLPFEPGPAWRAPAQDESRVEGDFPPAGSSALAETSTVVSLPRLPVLPFTARTGRQLSLEEHAALTAELAFAPSNEATTLAQRSLTVADKAALDDHHRAVVAADVTLLHRWNAVYRERYAALAREQGR